MINVVCVLKQGGKVGYDSTWVEKLKNSVQRNLTIPHNFISLSDCDVPCERIVLDNSEEGYWTKIQLFKKNNFNLPVLYFDLDTVICKNIDALVENCLSQKEFLMWKDTDYNISSSAIMYWNGDYSYIYEEFKNNPQYYYQKYSTFEPGAERLIGDQAVISSLVNHKFINDFCPKNWIEVLGKKNYLKNFDDARILIFRKAHSKPSTMSEHPLIKQHWK